MPVLPLDHPEPFAATVGVMLYPGVSEAEQSKARAFAAQFLAEPLQSFHQAGHRLSYDVLARIAMDAGRPLADLEERWEGGLITGDLFKTLYILAKDRPKLASWENAIRIYELCALRAASSGSRSRSWEEIRRFRSVAHLWAAWSIREGKFVSRRELDYDGYDDFQCFLTEAEILRDFGQEWRAPRAKSAPPLPRNVHRVPAHWTSPQRRPGWPNTGMIPDLKLPDDLLASLKSPGRARKSR